MQVSTATVVPTTDVSDHLDTYNSTIILSAGIEEHVGFRLTT